MSDWQIVVFVVGVAGSCAFMWWLWSAILDTIREQADYYFRHREEFEGKARLNR